MTTKLCLALLAVGALALPASAKDDSGSTTICHRTGGKAVEGKFPGHVIRVSNSAVATHVDGHQDVVLTDTAVHALGAHGGKKPVCLVDNPGNVYDSAGKVVQSVGGGWDNSGGDSGGPG